MGERVPITFTFAIGCIDYMLERDEELILLPIPNHQKIYVFFVNIKQIRLFLFIFGLMPDSDSPILTHSSTDVEYMEGRIAYHRYKILKINLRKCSKT